MSSSKSCEWPLENNKDTKTETIDSTKNSGLLNAPKLPYNVDLYNWGEEAKPTKILVQSDLHRFWGSSPLETEIEVPSSSGKRIIDFSGELF